MRRITGRKAALLCGAVSLVMLSAGRLHAQVTNPDFELPSDGASGTDSVATGWTLDPAAGDDYTNPGARCQFDTPTPSGGTWSLWLQTFVQSGDAQQVVTGITPGTNYALSAEMGFQDGDAHWSGIQRGYPGQPGQRPEYKGHRGPLLISRNPI